MNKIFKVIWSKSRNCYVVASELAKGHTKASSTGDKTRRLALAAITALMLLPVGGFSYAADTTKVEPSTSNTAVEVYTKEGTDKQIDAANKYTYRKTAELDQKLTDQKTNAALHISSSGNLIIGTKENQTVKDMEIRGKLTSGSISTGNINSSGDVTVAGKMAADGVTDETTKDGTYIKQNNTVGNNLVSLDKQVKSNADAIAKKANQTDLDAINTEVAKKANQTDLDETNSNLAKKANQTDLDETNANLAKKAEQTALDETNAEVAKKADAANVYTKAETDLALSAKANAADVYTKTDVDNKLTADKTSTALHISSSGDLIVGTKENQTVRDMEIRGKLTSGSLSTGDINSNGDVSVKGKMAAGGVTDETTKDGTYIKQNNTVGNNLVSLDTQVKANADAIAEKANATDVYTKAETDQKVDAANTYTYRKVAAEEKAREAKDNELNERITNEANAIHETTNKLQDDLNTETTAREAADTALDTRITNVKEYLEKQTSDNYVSKADAAVQDGAVVKAANTIGENVTNLDAALAKETAARIGADAAQDKVIQQVNQNMVDGFNTINKNMADGFTALNQADAKEAQERAAADAALDDKITAETSARVAADTKLVEAVNSGLSLSNDNVLQKNTTTIDAQGNVATSKTAAKEMILNKGNDNQITLNENGIKVGTNSSVMDKDGVYTGGDDYTAAKAALKSDGSIKGADGKFTVDGTNGNVNTNGSLTATSGKIGNVSMSTDGTMTGVKDLTASGKITADSFTDGTATMSNGSLNGVNQINATGNIVTTGNMKAHDITAEGTIKGETINGTTGTFGSLSTTGNASVGGTLTTNGIINTGNTTTDTLAVNHNATVGGNLGVTGDITGKSLNVGTGSISGGQITGTGLDVGAGTIKTTGATETGTLKTTGKAEIGGDLSVAGNTEMKGNLDVKGDLSVEGEFNANTLSSKLDENNYTTINGGKTQSVNLKMDPATSETKASASTFDETGSNMWAKDDDSIGKSTVTADGISQKLSDTGDNPTAYAESAMSQGTDNKYTMTDTVKDGDKTNVASQSATESSDVVTDVDGNTSTFRQKVDSILQEINNADNTKSSSVEQKLDSINSKVTDGTNTTSVEQGTQNITNTATNGTISNIADKVMNQGTTSVTSQIGDGTAVKSEMTAAGITNTAAGGTITNSAKDLVNQATGDMTNTVGGKMLNDVTGDMENKVGGNLTTTVGGTLTETVTGDVTKDYKANLSTTVGGNQTTTVTGDSSLTAENITNEAKNKITNKALDVETDASSSIVNKVSNDAGSNTSTQLSYQTTEEMSQADGKKASYLRGAAEEKSQLTDGDKKTTIDTIAGQTNTNITEGTNTSNSLQNANQIASSVTDGTNTTVVNQNATSLASSITDGTKANNTNNTVDKSEQLIKANDTQYSATSKTATKTEDTLVNGSNIIDILKDSTTGTVSSVVTDGTNRTGVIQTAKDITNTAKNGTIANDAKDIINNAAENMTNTVGKDLTTTVGGEMKTTVTGKTTKNYNGGLETTITGEEKHTVNGSQINAITGDQTNTISGSKTESVKGAVSETYGSQNTTVNGDQSTTVTGKQTNSITGDQVNTIGGSQTTTVTGDSTLSAKNITNTAKGGTIYNQSKDILNEATGDILNFADGEIGNVATKITNITGDTTVTSDTNGTTFENTAHNTALTEMTKHESGDFTKTTISGNTLTTGQATMDYAEVMKDLGVHGNATVDQKLTVKGDSDLQGNATVGKDLTVKGNSDLQGNANVGKNLTVNGTSDLKGDVTMESNATVKKDLTVEGTTKTEKLVVNNGATVTGGTTTDTLHVTSKSTFDGAATFKDVVTMEKDLSVGGNATVAGSMTASSYKVGDNTYIDSNGINANKQKVVNVAPGRIAADSTDAVNGSQLYQINERVTGVENKVNKLDSRVDKVGANAAALANLHPLEFDADSKWNIAAAVGGYKGETATAIGAFYRPNENVMVNVSSSFGTGENMYGGGISLRIGQGGNKARRNATNGLTDREKAMQKQIDSLTNRLDALLSVINPNMSKDFPDVPENHWAYEAVSRLAGNGVIQGYEDGKYHGDRTMTRYEMAEIIYNALSKGAKAEKKLVEEFKPELQAMAAQKKA